MTKFCRSCFAPVFKEYGNIQCLDCGNRQDLRTRMLLMHSDLVVIMLHQIHNEIQHLFCKMVVPCRNCIYVVTDYIPGWGFDLKDISLEFRIPKAHLACIPYCPGIGTDQRPAIREYSYMNFDLEVERSGLKILKALGF